MDVNGIVQNVVNLNSGSSNLSEYENMNTGAVPQVGQMGIQTTKSQEYNKKDFDYALDKVNNFMKDEHTHAEYSVHKDFGTIMIKIVDDDTKEVLLEIPPQKILDMVASMCRQVGLFDKKA